MMSSHQLHVLCKYLTLLAVPSNHKNVRIILIFMSFSLTEIFLFAQGKENRVCPGHCTLLWVKTSAVFFLITVIWFTLIHHFPCCLSHQVPSPPFLILHLPSLVFLHFFCRERPFLPLYFAEYTLDNKQLKYNSLFQVKSLHLPRRVHIPKSESSDLLSQHFHKNFPDSFRTTSQSSPCNKTDYEHSQHQYQHCHLHTCEIRNVFPKRYPFFVSHKSTEVPWKGIFFTPPAQFGWQV